MKKFYNLFFIIIIGLSVAFITTAFNGPTGGNPPNGGGVIGIGSNAPANSFYINSSGYVGVGTTTPATLFTVGTTANIFNVTSGGNVGIGTAIPGAKLEVNGYTRIAGDQPMQFTDTPVVNQRGKIYYDSGTGQFRFDSNSGVPIGIGNGFSSNVLLAVGGGNVGIGNIGPTYKLDVSGDVRWTGTLQGGSVPWARLTSFPAACSAGQYVNAVGSSLTCATPAISASLSCTISSKGCSGACQIDCGSGYTMTGGGCYTGGSTIGIYASYPNGNGWQCQSTSGAVQAFARCCKLQ